jgi:hypothetical protein
MVLVCEYIIIQFLIHAGVIDIGLKSVAEISGLRQGGDFGIRSDKGLLAM